MSWQTPRRHGLLHPVFRGFFGFRRDTGSSFFRFQLWSAGRRNRTDGRVLGCREKGARRRERSRPTVSGIVAVPQSLLFPERPSVQFSSRGGQEPAHEGSFALGDQKIHQVLGRFV